MLTKCPVCHSDRLTDKAHNIASCQNCTHMFQNPPDIGAVYDRDYVAQRYDTYPVESVAAMSALRLGLVKAQLQSGTLLDVGYGNGAFVKLAQRAGFDAYGNDVHGADYGVREVALTEKREWDVVTFFDSLEHFPDLELARPVIQSSRFVVVSAPATPPCFPGCAKEWRHYRPGEHLHYFTLESLTYFLRPHLIVVQTDAEDAIRGRQPFGQNILTVVAWHCAGV